MQTHSRLNRLPNRVQIDSARRGAAASPGPACSACGAVALAVLALVGCGGGGGGGTTPPPGPLTVTAASVLAGDPVGAQFRVSLPTGAVGPASFEVRTADTGTTLGNATGGSACSGNVDYLSVSRTVEIAAGSNFTTVAVSVCNNTTFEPAEHFELVTTYQGGTARAAGTVLNNAVGGLNDSGIDQCLNAAGALVACSATDLAGQDGQFGRDAQALTSGAADGRIGFAYASVGGNCVEDKVSGLTWDGNAPATGTQVDAIARVAVANAAVLCGFSDWRLPNAEELLSLVDAGAAAAPRIDARFAATPALSFWSSMVYAADTRAAWVVDFASGAVAFDSADNPLGKAFASRLVRGSSPSTATPAACDDAADTRFVNNGNGTVTDSRTGLMWQQCADGLSGADCATGSATSHASFSAALQRAAAVNADAAGAGRSHADWRLPNRNELASLVNRNCSAPTIARGPFPNTPSLSLWTSSPVRSSLVWYVDFTDGSIGPGGVNGGRGLRLVRGG